MLKLPVEQSGLRSEMLSRAARASARQRAIM